MRRLTVLFDPDCGFCVRCAQWLTLQHQLVPLEALPMDSAAIERRFPGLQKLEKAELTVIDDDGGVYRSSKAWLMCLWALSEWRAWSYRLARPSLMPLARGAFELVSSNRHRINDWLGLRSDGDLARVIARSAPAEGDTRCEGPGCAAAVTPATTA